MMGSISDIESAIWSIGSLVVLLVDLRSTWDLEARIKIKKLFAAIAGRAGGATACFAHI